MIAVLFALIVGSATFVSSSLAALTAFVAHRIPRRLLDALLGAQELAKTAHYSVPVVYATGLLLGSAILFALDIGLMHRFQGVDHHTVIPPPACTPPSDSAAAYRHPLVGVTASDAGLTMEEVELRDEADRELDGADTSAARGRRLSEERKKKRKQTAALLVAAMALHTVPEGLALGLVCSAGATEADVESSGATGRKGIHAVIGLAVGIAIHNVPESAAVAIPLRECGLSAKMTFVVCTAAAAVRPVMAVIGALIAVHAIVPFGLATACGAMLYVVVDDIIPMSHEAGSKHAATIGTMGGLVSMLVLITTIDALLNS
eukprot:m51a1_g11894 hypothetical protein (318) ;mRNA; r:601613-602738